jgi:MFS family permease
MSATTPAALAPVGSELARSQRRVIVASSLGTLFEWYDFYLYGSLSGVISRQFFSAVNETTGFIFALLAFGAGAFVRPLGALMFGRLGDLVGRKRTFLVTIVMMGLATFLVGCLPGYAAIGVLAPITLLALRLLQGLALGGEYGGAVVYVAEHAPAERRGRNTAWIQTTAGLGLLLSLLVILACRWSTGESFERFGWRIPFLLSVLLLAISVYIRLQLEESPVFREMQAEGALSKAPLKEAFGRWANVRTMLLVLSVSAGLAVIAFSAPGRKSGRRCRDPARDTLLRRLRRSLRSDWPKAAGRGRLSAVRDHFLSAVSWPDPLRQSGARESHGSRTCNGHRATRRVLLPVRSGR